MARKNLVALAFDRPSSSVSSRLVLVWLAWRADSDCRVRVVPGDVARATGLSVRRVEECLAGLNADGVIDAHKWNDTGAWSVRVVL